MNKALCSRQISIRVLGLADKARDPTRMHSSSNENTQRGGRLLHIRLYLIPTRLSYIDDLDVIVDIAGRIDKDFL